MADLKVEFGGAINSLGDWVYSITNNSLSEITFYNDAGESIEKPADFPSDSDITTRQKAMQDKIDSGSYKTIQQVVSEF